MSTTAGTGNKREFGSFHSSNVEELINTPENEYTPPVLSISIPKFDGHVTFGEEMKKSHFMLDDSWTFVNHGAFGAALKQAMEAKMSWLTYIESQPLRFFDRELLPLGIYIIRELAKFIVCDPISLVLIPNVTQGTNTVIQCIARRLSKGDRITTLNTNYGATKKLLSWVKEEYGLEVDEIQLHFPITNGQSIIDLIKERIHPDTKLAIFDHISSNYGIILPIKEIIAICHQKGIKVLIDGAHAPGALPLNIKDTGADYYVGNTHKWLCCPKGCAFLYVEKSLRNGIRSLIISHGSNNGFHSEFSWIGLMDYTSYLALLTVLQFWNHYGADNIRKYIHSQAKEAALLLTRAWNTELLADSSLFGSMVVVALPHGVMGLVKDQLTYSEAEQVQNTLYHRYKIEVPVKAINGKLYVRISYHIYNKLDDYQSLVTAINELCN